MVWIYIYIYIEPAQFFLSLIVVMVKNIRIIMKFIFTYVLHIIIVSVWPSEKKSCERP